MLLELTSLDTLFATVRAWRQAGQRVALVPTMGALHAGHMALVEHARTLADRVVVSIFVNPTQFGPNEDFSRYPRPLDDDRALLTLHNADALWLPDVATMYPQGFATSVHVSGVTETLDGAARPGHFDGVATVVSKLLNQVQPDIALFGEKDYQQLCVIKRLVVDMNMPVEIIAVPTLRETDGLALSSRNRYLSEAQRPVATRMNQVLRHSAFVMREEGRPVAETLEKAQRFLLDAGFSNVDYVALCDSHSLAPLENYRRDARLLAAARLGTTRLIDNIAVE